MSTNASPQVLIIGAGPTGLQMAVELSRRDVPFRIVEKVPHATDKSKALAIHARTLEMFDHQGIVGKFLRLGHEVHAMNMFADGKLLVRLTMDELDSPYPFVLALPQSETERLLAEQITAKGGQIERERELVSLKQDAQSVIATIKDPQGKEETITVQYVVGCDGAHSTTRHLLNLPFEGSQYKEIFWLADVELVSDFENSEGYLFNTADGLTAIIPFGNGRVRIILEFNAESEAARAEGKDPSLDQVQASLSKRLEQKILVKDPHWLAAFSISRRSVRQYNLGRIFLAGDAAHIHSPAGGQGMNTGLQDAYNLAWKLALVLKGTAKPDLLESYNIERHAVAQEVLRMTDFLTKVNMTRNPIAIQVRNALAPLLAAHEVVQQRMRNSMAELAINYRKSPIVQENKIPVAQAKVQSHTEQPEFTEWFEFNKGPSAGDRAPDAHLFKKSDNTALTLFDIMRGTEHNLLLLGGVRSTPNGLRDLMEIGNSVVDKYSQHIKVHFVAADEDALAPFAVTGSVYSDPDLSAHHKYGAASECLYLLRPDGYVGYRSLPADKINLHGYLEKIFA